MRTRSLSRLINEEVHIAPLAVMRVVFGGVMLFSTIRFILKGWVYDFYIAPSFTFPFYGFEWVRPLPGVWMYLVFILIGLASLLIMIGLFYRVAITVFFTLFIYTELIDKSYYLNHYYFVSVIAFLLLLVPAHRWFSMDVFRKPSLGVTRVPAWTINVFKAQLCLVYFLAGLSKLNGDWLLHAMPLRLWLPADANIPLIGGLLKQTWIAYAFSWFGALFDLSVGPLLWYRPTRRPAYLLVLIFHVFTGWLFKIGMFPYIMIGVTVIFFSENEHIAFVHRVQRIPGRRTVLPDRSFEPEGTKRKSLFALLVVFAAIQVLMPFRYLLYPGKLFWTEEGYRFSWRVMLMEKAGTAFFYVRDARTGKRLEVDNRQFLTPLQERMMETQPDMMLQYASHLHRVYRQRGIADPVITVESYVTLNGSGTRLYIDSTVNLAKEQEGWLPKKWILP